MSNASSAASAAADSTAKKVAVVTGSSRGLGAASARRLARDGHFVIVNYVRAKAEGEATVKSIVDAGGRAALVQGDVSDVAGIARFFDAVDVALAEASLPAKIDVLVANAGVILAKPFAHVTEAEFDALFDTNVKGVFFLIQAALPRLRDGGRVIALSSGLSRVSNPMFVPYSATKGAIDVMMRVLAQDLGARDITVNAVAPGAIDTDMNKARFSTEEGRAAMMAHQAIKKIGTAEEIADVVAFVASPAARWITGQRIEASGGMM